MLHRSHEYFRHRALIKRRARSADTALSALLLSENMEPDDAADDQTFFSCAICGLSEGDVSNLTTQNTLQTNATVGCGHQL